MNILTQRRVQRTTAIGLLAGTAALAVGGAAYAASPSTTPTSGGAAASGHAAKDHAGTRNLLRRAVHADVIVRTKSGYTTLQLDRGTVNSVSTSAISITRPDGPVVTANVNSTTHFRGQTEAQLTKGSQVLVIQTGGVAVDVLSRSATSSSGGSTGSTGTATPAA